MRKEHTCEDYLRIAKKYITDYHKRYYPFCHDRTIALRERILIDLDGYKLLGYIDRLAAIDDGCYGIHDYKTNSQLPSPEYVRNDRQLALYSIGVKQRYPDVKDVRLIWHFLKFDKEIDSIRTDDELTELKQNIIRLIDVIENAEEFPVNPSVLCHWCRFKLICR